MKQDGLGVFSNYKIESGDKFTRPTAGEGGYGVLERKPELVLEDVIDDYVSIERGEDYGVVIRALDPDILDYEIDFEATKNPFLHRDRKVWAKTDPHKVSQMYINGEIDSMDAVRRYAVILDWGTGELMPKSTIQFRESFERRSVSHWI